MIIEKIQTSHKQYSIQYGREKIAFSLSFNHRKSLKINVHPDKTVTVVAPKNTSLENIILRIKRRAFWIIKQKNYFERFQPLPSKRLYVSGESHYYLGKQYRLKVRKDSGQGVKLIGKYINVYTPNVHDTNEVKKLLQGWYRKHAESIFAQRLLFCHEAIKRIKIGQPPIRILHMKKRWGSCSKSGEILLNTELVKAPLHCIDYVIIHEICHLKIRPHNKEFYKLLTRCLPDWIQRKEKLERVVI